MDISYRPVKKSDYRALKTLIYDAWETHDVITERETVDEILDTYLFGSLLKSNYAQVAEYDGQAVGFLFGRHGGHFRSFLRPDWYVRYLAAQIRMHFSPHGTLALKMDKITARTNKKLKRSHLKHYDGELTLFVVGASYRGLGIGSHLVAGFHSFLARHRASSYYLYTDTYSTYGFYDARGYRKVAEETVDWEDFQEATPPRYFIYEYNLA